MLDPREANGFDIVLTYKSWSAVRNCEQPGQNKPLARGSTLLARWVLREIVPG